MGGESQRDFDKRRRPAMLDYAPPRPARRSRYIGLAMQWAGIHAGVTILLICAAMDEVLPEAIAWGLFAPLNMLPALTPTSPISWIYFLLLLTANSLSYGLLIALGIFWARREID